MKKAFLVDFNIRTRIVVDTEKVEGNPDATDSLITAVAHNKVMKNISSRLLENPIEFEEDEECPAGTFDDD